MRNKIFFLFTFVVFFSLHVKGKDNKEEPVKITVSKDTIITVHDYLNDTIKHLYGDVDKRGKYGGVMKDGRNFTSNYEEKVKKEIAGVNTQDTIGKPITLKITYDQLEDDSLLLEFPYATYADAKNGWIYDNKNFQIYICKEVKVETDDTTPIEDDSDGIAEDVVADSSDVEDDSNFVKIYEKYTISIILILLFTLFILSIILLYKIFVISHRLRMVYGKLDSASMQAKDNSSLKNEPLNEKYIESLRKDILNQVSAETNTLKNIIDTQSQVLSRQIMDMRSQLDFENPNTNIELPLLQQKEFETTDVKYNFEDNTFTLGRNEMNFFKIYARNENYFYTLIDDESMKKEFLKIIASYKECIEICDQSAFPKQVEPFEEGRLIREGERFIISKVLKVKLA